MTTFSQECGPTGTRVFDTRTEEGQQDLRAAMFRLGGGRTREQQRAAEIAGLRSSLAFWNSMSPERQADNATHIGTLRMRYERLTGEG